MASPPCLAWGEAPPPASLRPPRPAGPRVRRVAPPVGSVRRPLQGRGRCRLVPGAGGSTYRSTTPKYGPARRRTPYRSGAATGASSWDSASRSSPRRSEEHTSELQSLAYLVCRLLLEKKKKKHITN